MPCVRQRIAVFLAQVLSRALGGVTGPSSSGWEFGLKEFAVSPALASKPYATELPPKIKILGVHRDQVKNQSEASVSVSFSLLSKVNFCTYDFVKC